MIDNLIKKILVVAESIDVEDSSGTKGRVALIKNLHKAGFEVVVYHYTRKEIQLEGIPCFDIKENRRSLLFFLSRLERQIRYKTGWKLNKYIEQLFGFSFTLFNDRDSIVAGLRKITNFEPDLVLTLSKGGSFRPHHALLKMNEWHEKWLSYLHDPYPMHLYPRPYAWVEPGYDKKWRFVKKISEKAKYSAFPSKLLLEWMGSYFSAFQLSGFVIPHQLLFKNEKNISVPDGFDPAKFNIIHAGTLLNQRNPKPLVMAFEEFLKKFPDARNKSQLYFIGGKSKYYSWLKGKEREIRSLVISNDYIPFDQVLKVQENASVNVILEAKSEISPFLPGKFPHCIQAGKPILLLGPANSESRRLLGDSYEYWCEIDDISTIADLIEKLYFKWKENTLILERPDLIEYLSADHLEKVIYNILAR